MIRKFKENAWLFCSILVISLTVLFTLVKFDSFYNPKLMGEFDSYMVPTISLLNHGTMLITEEDIAQAKNDFPEFYEWISARFDAGYMESTRYGKNPFYFCTYSIVCIPFKLLLKVFSANQEYTFPLTNMFFLCGACFFTLLHLKKSIEERFWLVLALMVNPILAYISWCSAETFIYAMVIICLVFFYNEEYCKAAIAISIAGTLNITIMFFGFSVISIYLYKMFVHKKMLMTIKEEWKYIVKLAICFIPVFAPFVHNLLLVGKTNSTFSMMTLNRYWDRLLSYFFDLNLGIFPFFPIILFLFLLITIIATIKRNICILLINLGAIGVVASYSLAYHINCGMSGIARYNAWASPIFVFSVIVLYDQVFKSSIMLRIKNNIFLVSFFLSFVFLLFNFEFTSGLPKFNRLSSHILDNCSFMYNPSHTTFASRLLHVDGGYEYSTPLFYVTDNGNVTKILASCDDEEDILDKLVGDSADIEWLIKKVKNLGEGDRYISIPSNIELTWAPDYQMKEKKYLTYSNKSGLEYITQGFSQIEEFATWTDGEKVDMQFHFESGFDSNVKGIIHVVNVMSPSQNVIVFVNGSMKKREIIRSNGILEYDCYIPSNGIVKIELLLPNAASPYNLGLSQDRRKLGIGIDYIMFENYH